MRTNRPLMLVVLLSAVSAGAQTAPPPDPLAPVRSMGKPPVWKPFVGGYYGLDQSEEQARSGGAAFVGVYKDLLPSIVGVGASGEAYLGGYSGLAGVNGGVRALAELRGLFLKAGVDYDFQREDASFILSLTVPLRRGGILGHGTHLRVDWLPGRGNSWNFGLQVPLEPHMGKTRPRDTEVDMPRAKKPRPRAPIDPAVVAAMQEVRTSARGIAVLSTAFWSDDKSDRVKSLERTRQQILEFKKLIGQTSPDRPNGVSMESEVRILHDRLDLAFGLAAGAGAAEARAKGAPVATAAREVALDEVLYPYNRLFGQYKRPEELWGLVARARERFVARLDAAGLAGARRDAILDVFEDYLRVLEETREWWVKRLEADSRLAWLPFQLVLRDEQHDTQAEIDAIVSRAQRTPLVGGNTVHYWAGQQFQVELRRTIRAAEDYHVLWLHDYDGVDGAGNPDVVGYYISVEGYLQALTQRVREFDRTGKLPVYMILVDLNYWEANKGRLYTDVLQDPLGARARLPRQEDPENRKLQEGIDRAQQELREAVTASKRLQEEAARRGQGWLRKYVSVHLDVMNPADVSYRTSRLIGYLPIAPDNMVRDHRKIAFSDLTELDPGKGEALFGGVGVGEQYATATWEDRTVRLTRPRGPHPEGRGAALPEGERLHGREHPSSAAAAAEAGRLRRAGESPRGPGLDRDRDAGAQRPRLRTERREHRVGRALHADAAEQPDRRPRLHLDARAVGGLPHRRRATRLPRVRDRAERTQRPLGGLSPALPHARDLQPLPRDPEAPRAGDRGPRRAAARRALHPPDRRQ